MVDEYAAWYDRQLDPAWRDLLISPPGATEAGTPLVYILPMNTDDLVRMGKVYAKLAFITAGNVTQAARLAGRNRTEFYRLLERHSLEPSMFKAA